MNRPPRRRPGSRRDKTQYANGVGPEGLPVGCYKVEIVVVCRFDGTEMGRSIRYTAPDMDGETETRPIPGAGGALPRAANDDGFEKWRFVCKKCGHDRPRRDAAVEAALDLLFAPWARREARIEV